MPQYMMLIYSSTEGAPSPEEMPDQHRRWMDYTQSLMDAGLYLAGDALQGVELATTVRERGGQVQITDGPFAETKEFLGGYYLLEATNLDTVLEYARNAPNVGYGAVEVRPVADVGRPAAAAAGTDQARVGA